MRLTNVAIALAATFFLIASLACSTPSTVTPPTQTPNLVPTPSPQFVATGTPTQVAATALASHLFIPVGETRDIGSLGHLVEIVEFTQPPPVQVVGSQLSATSGGLACLRFSYSITDEENNVQTLCVVSFDETGDCSGLPEVTLDLQQFLGDSQRPTGNANLLESGDGTFYRACRTQTGAFRLQKPVHALPPLYFTIVDALGDGPYSIGGPELVLQRAGTVSTYSGDEISPPWIVPVSMNVRRLRLNEDLSVEFERDDCDVSPECTMDPEMLQAGDIMRLSAGLSGEQLTDAFNETSEELRDRFFVDRIGIGWSDTATVHPDARQMAFNRLAVLDLIADMVDFFDGVFQLRGKGIRIGYFQPWPAQTPLPFPFACFPDDIAPGETTRCSRIEEALQAEEARRIQALRDAGFSLWFAHFLDYRENGEYVPLETFHPSLTNFDGVLVGIGPNSSYPVTDIPTTLAGVVQRFAEEIGRETPVVLSLNGPPITAQTGGGFCEAEICPSDFRGMYDQTESVLDAAMRHLSRDQLEGFGVSLFEGSHFDIRSPYEEYAGFSLNRVGETGYNNPVLNIYRAQ